MIVFISWSGEASRMMAEGLKAFLHLSLGKCTPWVSSIDIEKGTTWSAELREAIKSAGYCIVCVTSENVTKPWINYEAGAIREGLEKRTAPWLLDVEPEQLEKLPLNSVQWTTTAREGTIRLVTEINGMLSEPHPPDTIETQFKAHWEQLAQTLDQARARVANPTASKRSPDDAWKEVVLSTREILERLPPRPPMPVTQPIRLLLQEVIRGLIRGCNPPNAMPATLAMDYCFSRFGLPAESFSVAVHTMEDVVWDASTGDLRFVNT